jgi:hypothetical protein
LPAERQLIVLAEMDMTSESNSKEVLEKRAAARFRKEERDKDGKKAMADYEIEGRAVAAKTARLRALRLAKEAADKIEAAIAPAAPARPKRGIRPIH